MKKSELILLIESCVKRILIEDTYADIRKEAPNYLRTRERSKKTKGSQLVHINEDGELIFKTK